MCLLDDFEENMIDNSDEVEIRQSNCIIELGVKRPFDQKEQTELKSWLNTLNDRDSHNILSDYKDGKYSFEYFCDYSPFFDIDDKCYALLKLSVVENILWIGIKKSGMSTPYVIYPNRKAIEWYKKYGQPDKDGVIRVELYLLFHTNNPIFGAFPYRLLTSSLQFQESIASLFIFNPIIPNNPNFETPRIWPCKELEREYENCEVTKWDNALQENKDNSGFQLWKIDKNMFACRIEQDHISEALEEKADSDKKTGNHHRVFSKTAFTFKVNDSQTGNHRTIFLKLRYLKGTNEIPDLEAYAFIV